MKIIAIVFLLVSAAAAAQETTWPPAWRALQIIKTDDRQWVIPPALRGNITTAPVMPIELVRPMPREWFVVDTPAQKALNPNGVFGIPPVPGCKSPCR